MAKTETRKPSTIAQQEICYKVIRLTKQNREQLEISQGTGIRPSTISVRWQLYKNPGRMVLKIKRYFKHPKITCAGAVI